MTERVVKKGDLQQPKKCCSAMTTPQHRGRSVRRPSWWIAAIATLICVSLLGARMYTPFVWDAVASGSAYRPLPLFSPPPVRELTDQELAARAFAKDVLRFPDNTTKNPKVAFLFLTPGPLPLEDLWERFLRGHEGRYSIYIHSSKVNSVKITRKSPLFSSHDIRSQKVDWGRISMVDAEKRLLTHALEDPDNQHFVLLSDSCVPVRSFDYVYDYLIGCGLSFVDCFDDPGPHGRGRYTKPFLPEIQEGDWRKGSQWFTLKRQHALLLVSDYVYYTKFKHFCKPGSESHNCYPDEHYLQTFLHMIDPAGVSNWSVTHVDWSEGKWHPKRYTKNDVNMTFLQSIQEIDETFHVSSDAKRELLGIRPCIIRGERKPCYLFARKFSPETQDKLLEIFHNVTNA